MALITFDELMQNRHSIPICEVSDDVATTSLLPLSQSYMQMHVMYVLGSRSTLPKHQAARRSPVVPLNTSRALPRASHPMLPSECQTVCYQLLDVFIMHRADIQFIAIFNLFTFLYTKCVDMKPSLFNAECVTW